MTEIFSTDELNKMLSTGETKGTEEMTDKFKNPPASLGPKLSAMLAKEWTALTPQDFTDLENIMGEEECDFIRTYDTNKLSGMWTMLRDYCLNGPNVPAYFSFELTDAVSTKEILLEMIVGISPIVPGPITPTAVVVKFQYPSADASFTVTL
jgi:hypothetical protein